MNYSDIKPAEKVKAKKTVTFKKQCSITGEWYIVHVLRLHYNKWRSKKLLIQQAFDYLDEDAREIIKSGATPAEWKACFPDDDFSEKEAQEHGSIVTKLNHEPWEQRTGKE